MTHQVSPAFSGLFRLLALASLAITFCAQGFSQNTVAGTQIQNQASASYSDGSGGSYSSVSNTVTVTVAQVSGIVITPDAGSIANVVPGQNGVDFTFRVTNTGNFSDRIKFLANGASVTLTGSGTVAAA